MNRHPIFMSGIFLFCFLLVSNLIVLTMVLARIDGGQQKYPGAIIGFKFLVYLNSIIACVGLAYYTGGN